MMFLLLSLISCSDERYYGPMRGWEHMGYYGYGGMLMWIIFIVIFGVLIYVLMQATKGRGRAGETHLDILKKRYAKGEISLGAGKTEDLIFLKSGYVNPTYIMNFHCIHLD